MADNKNSAIPVDQFRVAHSEPAGMIALELRQGHGASAQFLMTLNMVHHLMKSLQDQISKTHGKFN